MKRGCSINQTQLMIKCEKSLKLGKVCQIAVDEKVVNSEWFRDWIFKLYQSYPATQLKEQLRFIDRGNPSVKQGLILILQQAALQQFIR